MREQELQTRFIYILIALGFATSVPVQATDFDRAVLMDRFRQLKEQFDAAVIAGTENSTAIERDERGSRSVQPVVPNERAPQMAIKFWVQQAIEVDGRWIAGRPLNLSIHNWLPDEPFFVSVSSATEVRFALFWNRNRKGLHGVVPPNQTSPIDVLIPPGQRWVSPMIRYPVSEIADPLQWIAISQSKLQTAPDNVHSMEQTVQRLQSGSNEYRAAYENSATSGQGRAGRRNLDDSCQIAIAVTEIATGQFDLRQ